MKPRKGLTPDTAREIIDRCQAHGNFHALPAAAVESLLVFADEYHYRKPRNANGSRGRYFHALLQRRALDRSH
jgi:hypothetical protein